MRVGLIDVDAESRGKVTFPNLSLMKISAWHKEQGDSVEWYRKPTAPKITRQLARWVNAPNIFWSVPTFEEYRNTARKER